MDRDHLHVVMLPWSAFGHLIPFFQLSIALARSGINVSFVSTPRNIQRLPKLPPSLATFIKFVEFPLPTLDNNDILPQGAEASVDVPADKVEYLKLAYDRLQYPINQFVAEQLPDWIIADYSAHWAVEIAQNYNVGFIYFAVFSAATVVFFGKPPNYFFVGDQKKAWPSPESLTSPPEWLSFPSSVAFRGYEAVWAHAGRGGARNFCSGGPNATLIYLSRQLPHTYIYTYARFFIIYTHFLFDKLYIYTQPKKKKKEFSIFNQNYF